MRQINLSLLLCNCMKSLIIISLLSSLLNINIKSDYIANVTNNTGNSSYANIAQLTYWYTSDDSNYEIELSAPDFLGITSNYQQTFIINININFKQAVDQAHMTFKLPTPRNTTHTANFNIISENAYVLSNFSDTIDVTAYNTDFVHIKLIFSWEQLEEYYGLSRNLATAEDPDVNYWATEGNLHVYVSQFQVDSVTLSTSPNYNTQLNSLISNTDTIESLLNSIVTNTNKLTGIQSSLTTINTNITSLKTVLNNIYDLLDQRFMTEDLYQSVLRSNDHRVKNASIIYNSPHISYLPTDFVFTGPGRPGYKVIYDEDNEIGTNLDRTNLKVVYKLSNYNDAPYYFLNIPISESDTISEYQEKLYVYTRQNSRIYVITLMVQYSNKYVAIFCQGAYYTISNPVSTTGSNADVFSEVVVTDQPITTEEFLQSLLKSFDAFNDIYTDPNEDTIDNFFDQLHEDLVIPEVEGIPSDVRNKLVPILRPFIKIFAGQPEITQGAPLDIYQVILKFIAFASLFGVIFL